MTDFLKSMAVMVCSCAGALILGALTIEPAPVPAAPPPTPATVELILTPAPGHGPWLPLYPLNDGREPVDMPRFRPE